MGFMGGIVGIVFFITVSFAAVTSSVSVMEAIVSSAMDRFKISRKKATVIVTIFAMVVGVIVCLGYNKLYFELKLPNGSTAQILDILDYISNNCFMPLVGFLTCILIGWVAKPKWVIDEMTSSGHKFSRQTLYIVMIRYIAPVLLFVLLLQSIGILKI